MTRYLELKNLHQERAIVSRCDSKAVTVIRCRLLNVFKLFVKQKTESFKHGHLKD